jgi:hypothetical protein
MIELFGWMKALEPKPWLIFGKGPSFDRHKEFPDIDKEYHTVALNHACRNRPVFVGHMIDANVLDEVDGWEEKARFILMPWQPHVKFSPTDKTLDKFAVEHPVLASFEKQGRLLWYNLATGKKPRTGSPPVLVNFFSAEAVVRFLAMAGVKKIRTLGVDGGNTYAQAFKDITPFRGGHKTFDYQTGPIQKTVKEFGLDYAPLA